jgi:hypothetical protein
MKALTTILNLLLRNGVLTKFITGVLFTVMCSSGLSDAKDGKMQDASGDLVGSAIVLVLGATDHVRRHRVKKNQEILGVEADGDPFEETNTQAERLVNKAQAYDNLLVALQNKGLLDQVQGFARETPVSAVPVATKPGGSHRG